MVRLSPVTGILLLSVIATSACGGQQYEPVSPKLPRPTPAPRFQDAIEKVPRRVILEYARSLVFDSMQTVGDQQRLMIGKCPDSCRYGPLVDIQAEVGIVAVDVKALQGGRIVGRYVNRSSMPYEKLGIPANQESFIWVDYVGGKWRAFVVPTDERLPLSPRRADFEQHTERHWAQSSARWKWKEDDETAWITCTVGGCCKIDP